MQSNTLDEKQTKAAEAGEGEYFVSEVFHSIQGEGVKSGLPMTFVRFGGCNLRCRRESVGFDCDTDFQAGQTLELDEFVKCVGETSADSLAEVRQWVLFTGGEPGLQLDQPLVDALRVSFEPDPLLAVETNGTVDLSGLDLDWICVSPKSAWHTLRQREADELKLVREHGRELPDPNEVTVNADHCVVSPACQPSGGYRQQDLDWCRHLVEENPKWRLSLQTHKFLGAR